MKLDVINLLDGLNWIDFFEFLFPLFSNDIFLYTLNISDQIESTKIMELTLYFLAKALGLFEGRVILWLHPWTIFENRGVLRLMYSFMLVRNLPLLF